MGGATGRFKEREGEVTVYASTRAHGTEIGDDSVWERGRHDKERQRRTEEKGEGE